MSTAVTAKRQKKVPGLDGERVPPECKRAMEMMVDLWETPEDTTLRERLDDHMAHCTNCANVVLGMFEMQMQEMDAEDDGW